MTSPRTGGSEPNIWIAQDSIDIQKKTCTRWINWRLAAAGAGNQIITDLSYDLRSGTVLLQLLSHLTGAESEPEAVGAATPRLRRLANMASVLGLMQRERARVDGLDTASLVEGDAHQTLQLVWSLIYRWEIQKAVSSLPVELQSLDIQQLLLAWIHTAVLFGKAVATDLAGDLRDGELLCRLVLAHCPDLTEVQAALALDDTEQRLSTFFNAVRQQLNVPVLLDSQDVACGHVDGKSLCCYLSLLMAALPNSAANCISLEAAERCPPLADLLFSGGLSGSPVKTPTRRRVKEVGGVADWSSHVEEVLSWLLEAEDHLVALNSLGQKHLMTVKTRFYNHEDFMLELQSHQGSLGQVLEQGGQLLASVLNPEDREDIRLQMNVLTDRWSHVRELALAKQTELHQLVMKLQLEQVSGLRNWMSLAEERLSRLGEVEESRELLAQQLMQLEQLQADLENQHVAVSAISNFIVVDTEDTTAVEDELAAIAERWVIICGCTEERAQLLQEAEQLWQEVDTERDRLAGWLAGVEKMLRDMEQKSDLDNAQLQDQMRRLMTVQRELEVEEGRLTSLGNTSLMLQERLGDKHAALPRLCSGMESLQDRWDVLIDIFEAQKQRISRLGVEFCNQGEEQVSDPANESPSSAGKRKVTGSKRIEFETWFARLSGWAEHILARLEEGVVAKLELEDQTLLYEETEAEVDSQRGKVEELVNLGRELIKDIESEKDFPPEYLCNVTRKEETCRAQLARIESGLVHLRQRIHYQVEKQNFYSQLGQLSDQLSKLSHTEDWRTAAENQLTDLKKLAAGLALHPAVAVLDPANTIKRDLYALCEQFDAVETAGYRNQSTGTPESSSDQISPSFDQDLSAENDATKERKLLSVADDDGNNDETSDFSVSKTSNSNHVHQLSSRSCHEQESSSEQQQRAGGHSEDTCYSSSLVNSEEASVISLPLINSSTSATASAPVGGHYEEYTVSSTITIGRLPAVATAATVTTTEKSEVFITMAAVPCATASRQLSELELDLAASGRILANPLFLASTEELEDALGELTSQLDRLEDAFVPANLTDEEAAPMLSELVEVKGRLRARQDETKELLERLAQCSEEMSGLGLWMKEVKAFLGAEEAAYGELETLEAQLRESNALQEDIATLEPNVENINQIGNRLLCQPHHPTSNFPSQFSAELAALNQSWLATVTAAHAQNSKLRRARDKSREVLDLLTEINNFLDQLEQELPSEGAVVTQAPELSQRTYRLLQLRDKTDRKSSVLDRLSSTVAELLESEKTKTEDAPAESEGAGGRCAALSARLQQLQARWSSLTEPVSQQYVRMKEATSDYGEFKTLVAQESDWLDRLEKKLRRSSKCAADAEEISEELDDLENCLHNHPEERIPRLRVLADGLSEKDVLISPVHTEAERLAKRWKTLERQTRERIKSLEECITEAQEWECKILAVQDWLSEKDMLLTSHLEHELTVDDLPDETQRMLREFEDKENILADMDEQVDAYRNAGKEEAASRLEDQLTLIHTKFQELSSKFELFQRPADYEGRLSRITRQLRDIQHNMYLTELVSHEPDSIHGQLHHTRCIYNALADIKPEVEATIKMGRRLVETKAVQDPPATSKNIDSLKELFNLLGSQVTEAREVLEKALGISETLVAKLNSINRWLCQSAQDIDTLDTRLLGDKMGEMRGMKREIREVLAIKQEFVSLCADPSLLVSLKETLSGLESKWSGLRDQLRSRLPEGEQTSEMAELDLSGDDSYRLTSPATTLHSISSNSSGGDEAAALQEFRAAFQEVTGWLDEAERRLELPASRRSHDNEDNDLGQQLANLRPKVEKLATMAVSIMERFTCQQADIEPEMEHLEQRWEAVTAKIEEEAAVCPGNGDNKTVMTAIIDRLALPRSADPLTSTSSEEIMTLPEENPDSSSQDSSLEFHSAASPRTPPPPLRRQESAEKEVADPVIVEQRSASVQLSSPALKTPPPTLPKPRWYVESLQEPWVATSSIASAEAAGADTPPPVRQVIITSATLPSPHVLPPQQFRVQKQRTPPARRSRSPERTVLPPADLGSVSTSPLTDAPRSVLDDIDRQNARDNEIIDRLLRNTSADIEDVRQARRSYSGSRTRDGMAGHLKDVKEFEEKYSNILTKLALTQKKLQELEKETDAVLRADLIDMEMRQLEAEVATTISRGDTLVLMVHRFDAGKGEGMQEKVTELRDSWSSLKQLAEKKKTDAANEAENTALLKDKLETMSASLNIAIKSIEKKATAAEQQASASKEVCLKADDMKAIEALAVSLQKRDSLSRLSAGLCQLRASWFKLQQLAEPPLSAVKERRSKSRSPREVVDRAVPLEIFNRITKLQEALAAVHGQLDTSIMSGRQYENLALQADTLAKVRTALESLKPRLKKAFVDMEHVSGSLSMEYFDKLTARGEKLRDEWREVNEAFVARQATWRDSERDVNSFNREVDELGDLLAAKEKVVLLWKQVPGRGPEDEELARLLADVEAMEPRVQALSDLGRTIAAASGSTQARDILSLHERIRKRWRFVFTETSTRRDYLETTAEKTANQRQSPVFPERQTSPMQSGDERNGAADSDKNVNIIDAWAEDALSALSKNCNVSELKELRVAIKQLQVIQAGLAAHRANLEDLLGLLGVSAPGCQQARLKLEKIGQLLPKRLNLLIEKSERLVQLVEAIEAEQKWVANMLEARHLATNNNNNNDDQAELRLAVSEKEYTMNKLMSQFQLLEREVTGLGLVVNTVIDAEMAELRTQWFQLTAEARRFTPAAYSLPQTQLLAAASTVKIEDMPKTSSSHSVASYISASLTSPNTSQSSEPWAASPTTATASPMSEEVMPVIVVVPGQPPEQNSMWARARRLSDWLAALDRPNTARRICVADTLSVGAELDLIRSVLGQMEARRQQKDELIQQLQAEQLGAGEDLRLYCDELMARWHAVQQELLARKTELTAMLEHSDNVTTKGKEVAEWLSRLEAMCSESTVGKTRDVLLRQIREVNQVHRELQQYGHHVSLLSQVCQRLVSIYNRDNTEGITTLREELTRRYSTLTSASLSRGKTLQAALLLLNQFDSELAAFLAWIGEVEASLERLETANEASEALARLEEVRNEVRERDREFHALAARGREQLETVETDIVLGGRVGELGRRWTALQNVIMDLTDRLGRQAEQARKAAADLLAWVGSKTIELTSLCVGSTLQDIHRQAEEHTSFREKLRLKETEYEALCHNMELKESEELRQLEAAWRSLADLTAGWEHQLHEAEQRAARTEERLAEVEAGLKRLELASLEWDLPPSPDTADSEKAEVEATVTSLQTLETRVMEVKLELESSPSIEASSAALRLQAAEQRLTSLQEAAAARRAQLTGLAVRQDPGSQEFLRDSVPEGWDRCLTEDQVPYYSCHATESTTWDHPEFDNLLQALAAMNTVKFCAYRLALKLRKVQQRLCLDLLDICSAVVCFDSHGLSAEKHDLTMGVPEMVTVLTSIYETLYQCEPEDIDVALCVDLCLNWLLNVYDSQRQGFVRVLSFKLGIALLCRGPLTEKYAVMFGLAAGSTAQGTQVDQKRLGLLLHDCMQLPRYLGEIALFGGSNIEPSVRSCMKIGSQEPRNSIDLSQFLAWLGEEPQSLVWLPVLHRLAAAETATHDIRCKICRVYPIVGFRYHCRRCFNLDICHACFFLGKTIKGHKPEHPMQEYCTSTTRTDNARFMLQAVRNSFRSRKYFMKKKQKLGYLPVQTVQEGENFESPAMTPNLSLESRDFQGSLTEGSLSSKLGHETSHGSLDSRTEEDEHCLIASYCKLLTTNNNNHLELNAATTTSFLRDLDTRLDSLEKEAVEQLIQQLREENSRLEAEYQELVAGEHKQSNSAQEEKVLRQQKSRLEARMTILEDHNRQLEAQLDRLRQLVISSQNTNGTLQSRFVVAAELHHGDSSTEKEANVRQPPPPASALLRSEPGRRQPPTALNLSKVYEIETSSCQDCGTSNNRDSATSGSLNLSQHNTGSQEF